MARTTIRTEDITDSEITSVKILDGTIATGDMAVDPTNASNLSSGSVPLAQLGNVDTSGITANKDDIALLGFKVAANGSLARYNLVDQSIDAFEDDSGVDASASTNETRNASNYYSGEGSSSTQTEITTTGSGTWTSPSSFVAGSVKVLVVAGGGSSAKSGYPGPAGGAGGLVYVDGYAAATSTTYNLTVGVGGTGSTSYNNCDDNGDNSVFDSSGTTQILTATGGGTGRRFWNGSSEVNCAGSGGSGGGGSGDLTSAGGAATQAANFGSYTGVGFGNAGGTGDTYSHGPTGGGGGAGGAGGAFSGQSGGASGAGKDYSSVFGTDVGDSGWFASGGGGGRSWSEGGSSAVGSNGGGGDGYKIGTQASVNYGGPGAANTGGGGGASGSDNSGADGGSGVIIIKYDTETYTDMTLISNAQTAESAPTTGDLVMTISNGAGTTTPNTDIKAYITRDGSDYTTAVTLVDQGDTGGHTILTANGVDLSGETSGTSMRWKIETLNQSVSKTTRIQAVSLGWS